MGESGRAASNTGASTDTGGIALPEGLRFRYRKDRGGPRDQPFCLEVPPLELAPGRRAVCIGPSGSGKTTLLHLLSGILLPERGRILVGGEDLCAMDEGARRRFRIGRVGMVFQEFELLGHLTVRDNVCLPFLLDPGLADRGIPEERLEQLAEATGIAPLLQRKPQRISQGERQRVAICRALIAAPAVVLADEPTGNLDPANTGRALDLLLAAAESQGATVLVVTHDHTLLRRFDEVLDVATWTATPAPGGPP